MTAASGTSSPTLDWAIGSIGPLDERAMAAARARLDSLTKPRGSLGRLEELAVQLAGITGLERPRVAPRAVVVMAGDHGIAAAGVSAYPARVTAEMVRNFLGGGAAVNALARLAAADLFVVDIGVATPLHVDATGDVRHATLLPRRIRDGTSDISVGAAMTRDEAVSAIETGLRIAIEIQRGGARAMAVGEMGIGNTTAASAVVAGLVGRQPREVTGRGTGIDDSTLAQKISLIERALAVNRPQRGDPIGVLASLGGLEIAGLVGLILGAAALGVPVILDGFITGAAALVAAHLCPAIASRLIAAHRSTEPGHRVVLDELHLRPLLELDLRLGEASGAVLALGILDAACAVVAEMATFTSAAVSGSEK